MRRLQDVLPLAAWLGSLTAGIVLFTQLGDGALATPALTDAAGWRSWLQGQEAVLAGVALLRLLVLGLAWYLVGVTTLGLVARLLRLASLARVADAISGPIVRHVLRQALGVSMAVGVVAASTGAAPRAASDLGAGGDTVVAAAVDDGARADARSATSDHGRGYAAPTVRPIADAGSGPTVSAQPMDAERGPDATDRVTAVPLPPALSGPIEAPGADELGDVGPADDGPGEVASAASPAGAPPVEQEHTVSSGEHLWSIAAQVVEGALGRTASDAEVGAYWQVLIEDNRDRLANPDDPDLLFPAQVLRLPDVSAAVDT